MIIEDGQAIHSLYFFSGSYLVIMVLIDTMIFNRLRLSYGTPSMTKEKVTGEHEQLFSMNDLYPVYFPVWPEDDLPILNLQEIVLQSLKKEMN